MSSADTEVQQSGASVPIGAKTAKKSEKKTATAKQAKPNHPPTSEMVNNAIKDLKERSGSSLQAIKKFIASNYKVDSEKLAPFIKKYLKSAVQSGSLVQTKGKGASGSFKLAAGGSTSGSQKKVIKKATSKSKDDLKKSTSASAVVTDKKKKKSTVAKKQAAVTKTKKAVATTEKKSPKAAKSPSKAKKIAKSPTKKPKAPKPKSVKSVATPKKAAPLKKKK
ncbi:histone H1B-like [Harmonia axyridis]|uniref:histone H1B-like n=1 Tax=Harmonia axyridis TaxID=115357 RepID=UPI001E277C08|nr:histone H1B-like [Harmonia axyridis]